MSNYNIPEDFDWVFYLDHYKDLKSIFSTKEDAESHYINFGANEKRLKNMNDLNIEKKQKDLYKPKIISNRANQLKNLQNFNQSNYKIIKNHNLKYCKISVIISLYNYEKFINYAIDSVISNSFDSCEIVVVNDCSTDNSINLVNEYLKKDCNLTIIDKNINTGLAHTRNLGIEKCVGDFVFILDADNKINNGCLEKLYNFITENNLDSAYSTIECFDEKEKFIRLISNDEFEFHKLREGPYIDAMALFNREKMMSISGYDMGMPVNGWEDYDMWLNISISNFKVGHLKERLCWYLVKSDSMISETNLFHEEMMDYLKKKYNF
jgi:glycosyltransferase involved in cell wall biosynthesis